MSNHNHQKKQNSSNHRVSAPNTLLTSFEKDGFEEFKGLFLRERNADCATQLLKLLAKLPTKIPEEAKKVELIIKNNE
jgi:hypothetical protein